MKASALAASALLIGLLTLDPAMARGPWRASETNTRGWQLMSPQERLEHQRLVRGFTTLAECRSYQLAHHQLMAERARQRGLPQPAGGQDICAHLAPGPATR